MICLDTCSALQLICKTQKVWGLHFRVDEACEHVFRAAPWLKAAPFGGDDDPLLQMVMEEHGIVLFETEDEMVRCFEATVGDTGPTKTNPYDGPCRVYVATCDPDGQLLNENT